MANEGYDESKDQFSAASTWADQFDLSIKAESTRAKVVLSVCYLDELLHQLVAMVLKPVGSDDPLLDGSQAPLGSFSAKIELVYRMGIISEDTHSSLHLVRKIRNRFAHSLASCDFGDAQIRSWNADLHRLNDHATPERRATFSDGPVGDFEKSVSWLVFQVKHTIQTIPSKCPDCGTEMKHRARIKAAKPGDHA
jgi:DNA-binding MltR family transcriptional regulator